MTLQDLLDHRRAVRHFDPAQPIDENVVRRCIEQAALAPTSSNLQLWEAVHVTDPEVLQGLAHACFDQQTARTAQQMVVFVARRDKHRDHTRRVLEQAVAEIRRSSPADRQEGRIRRQTIYYAKLVPFLYTRCFGLLGLLRKGLSLLIGCFRPIMQETTEGSVRVSVHKSCALVVQTFLLAMAEAGYDTCPLEGYDSHRVARLLGLPRGAEVNMIITCGKRLPSGVWGARQRLPFEECYRKV